MRYKSGTVRVIDGYHRLDKLREYTRINDRIRQFSYPFEKGS